MLPLRDELPTRTFPWVNYALIAANVVVFLAELAGSVGGAYAYVPARLWVDPSTAVLTVFTAMFLHGGWLHLGGNMLYLWIFGDNVEDAMGHGRYLVFYVLCGLCAAAGQTAVDPVSPIPMLGASGAIAGVLAGYVFLYPRSPVTVLNPVPLLWIFWGLFLRFPAWLVIGFFFVVNLWDAVTNSARGGVAFAAHVGGFIGGAVLLRVFLLGRPRFTEYDRHARWVRRRDDPRGWS